MKSLRPTIIIAAVLYVLDAFVLNQGLVALVLFAVVLFYFVPATLWAVREDRRLAGRRLAKLGIFLLAAISILVTNGLQNRIADRKAIMVGDACEAYRAKYHHYPKQLSALVPEFIPSVPSAKYGLLGGEHFFYSSRDDDAEPILFYQAVPPFGRRFYHMKSRSWGYLD